MIPTAAKALIFSDLDDTLQPRSTRTIDPRFFAEIPVLAEKGVCFCIASGRYYGSLLGCLAPVAEDIFFICENGAEIYYGQKLLYRTEIDRALAREIVESIIRRPDCFARINAAENYYIAKPEDVARMGLPLGKYVSSIDEVEGEIRMITAACPENNRAALAELQPMWEGRVEIAVNGPHWIDFTPMGKGKAVHWLCQYLGVNPAQAYAFGDNYNDCSMLEAVGHPFLMEIAPKDLKAQFSNHTHSVIETVLQLEHSGIL